MKIVAPRARADPPDGAPGDGQDKPAEYDGTDGPGERITEPRRKHEVAHRAVPAGQQQNRKPDQHRSHQHRGIATRIQLGTISRSSGARPAH